MKESGKKLIAQNKKARHDYLIDDVFDIHAEIITTPSGNKMVVFE